MVDHVKKYYSKSHLWLPNHRCPMISQSQVWNIYKLRTISYRLCVTPARLLISVRDQSSTLMLCECLQAFPFARLPNSLPYRDFEQLRSTFQEHFRQFSIFPAPAGHRHLSRCVYNTEVSPCPWAKWLFVVLLATKELAFPADLFLQSLMLRCLSAFWSFMRTLYPG